MTPVRVQVPDGRVGEAKCLMPQTASSLPARQASKTILSRFSIARALFVHVTYLKRPSKITRHF